MPRYLKIFPEDALTRVGFDKLASLLEDLCISSLGKRQLQKLKPSAELKVIERWLAQVREYLDISSRHASAFDFAHFSDLGETLDYLEKENSYVAEEIFLRILLFGRSMARIYTFFYKHPDKYPALAALLKEEAFNRSTIAAIEYTIDNEGHIKSGISKELDSYRADILRKEREIDKAFNQVYRQAAASGWLSSGGESVHNGRRVLVLAAEHKRKIKGIILDESATGKSVYLEPEQTIELGNDLLDLRHEERREIHRILRSLADTLRPHLDDLRTYQRLAGIFDFVQAKAHLAQRLRADIPHLNTEKAIDIKSGRHPMLYLKLQAEGRPVVPLSVSLNDQHRILLISGPNAGGKSVALKTAVLLQLMVQCGLAVPAAPESSFGVFEHMAVEIGDSQSIENDLSTYSSHLRNMHHTLENAFPGTVVYIDELGSGTDPEFGGAIAEAILAELLERGSRGVVTTHFSNLKLFAGKSAGILNASMAFDPQEMRPTFQMVPGQAGSSHALEIAQRTGFSQKFLQNAEGRIRPGYREYDGLLASLETEKIVYERLAATLQQELEELARLKVLYGRLRQENEQARATAAKEARATVLADLQKRQREILKQIQEQTATAAKLPVLKRARQQLQALQTEVKDEQQRTAAPKPAASGGGGAIQVGSHVRLADDGQSGVVESIKKDTATVAFPHMKMSVGLERLRLDENPTPPASRKGVVKSAGEPFRPTLDIRGFRVDEGLSAVEQLLDRAIMAGYGQLYILHGKGNGILRQAVRDLLKKYDFISRFYSEHADAGGDGITVVELK